MKVLVVGSGAREHSLVWKCVQSDLVERVYCAPGNGGTGGMARNIAIERGVASAWSASRRGDGPGFSLLVRRRALAAGGATGWGTRASPASVPIRRAGA